MDNSQSVSSLRVSAQQSRGHQSQDKAIQAAHDAAHAEKQSTKPPLEAKKSVYAGLGWLDRLLALWILLAIVVGILLGNFVDNVGPALQRGKFVGVSIPIGEQPSPISFRLSDPDQWCSRGSPDNDVSYTLQG